MQPGEMGGIFGEVARGGRVETAGLTCSYHLF